MIRSLPHNWSGWPGAWCLDCGIADPVERDMLDGRENDEQITVEVSLLWSLLDSPLDEERLARAIQWAETPVGATLPPIDPFIERAAAIVKADILLKKL